MRSTLTALLLVASLPSQKPELVHDANKTPLPESSNPEPGRRDAQRFVLIQGVAYFLANDLATGTELYRTDGTRSGTRLVKDIRKGEASSGLADLVVAGQHLYFRADDGVHGAELWRSDGTASGTQMVADIRRGGAASAPSDLAVLHGQVVFAADDGTRGRELWITDGSRTGTQLLHDVRPGPAASNPVGMTTVGTKPRYIYFAADDGKHGVEPWLTSGKNTVLLKDIHLLGSSNARNFVALGNRVLFEAENGANGFELWASDGSNVRTTFVRDIEVGPGSGTDLSKAFVDGNYAYFTGTQNGKQRIWRSDGTSGGTREIGGSAFVSAARLGADLILAARGGLWRLSLATSQLTVIGSSGFDSLERLGSLVYARQGEALWRIDGTPYTQRRVGPSRLNPRFLTNNGRALVFAAGSKDGVEPWISDGTDAGTKMIADLRAGNATKSSAIYGLTAMGTHAYFSARVDDNGNIGIFRTDGTPTGTTQLASFPTLSGTVGRGMVRLGNQVFFTGHSATTGVEPWVTDGTPSGTRLLRDLEPGTNSSVPYGFVRSGKRLFFLARTAASGREIWVTDGTPAGTRMVDDLEPGPKSTNPSWLVPVGDLGRVVFSAFDSVTGRRELFASLGTAKGTGSLQDPWNQKIPDRPFDIQVCGDQVYFMGYFGSSSTTSPWVTDGVTTRAIGGSVPRPIAMSEQHGTCYYLAHSPSKSLWQTDGTATGTRLVTRLPNTLSLLAFRLAAVGSRHLYLAAKSTAIGNELWRLDRTPNGIVSFDIFPGASSSEPSFFRDAASRPVMVGSRVLFVANDGLRGNEVWASDNGATSTPVGTRCGHGSGPPPRLSMTDPLLGATLHIGGRHAPTGGIGAMVLGEQASRPIPVGSGCESVVDLARVYWIEAFPSLTSSWSSSARVPNVPALSGVSLAWQVWYLPATGPQRPAMTNGVVTTFGQR